MKGRKLPRRHTVKKYAILLAMILSNVVMADTANLSWTAPTARTDGTPLGPDEIASYTLMMNDQVLYQTVAGTSTTIQIDNLDSGEYCFEMNTTDTEGRSGPFGDVVCKTVKAAPGAPSTLVIDIVF